jgi:hypothetical protein
VVGEPGVEAAAEHGEREAGAAGERGLLQQHGVAAERDRVEERGPVGLAVVGAPVHEQRLARTDDGSGGGGVHHHAVGRLLGGDARLSSGVVAPRCVAGLVARCTAGGVVVRVAAGSMAERSAVAARVDEGGRGEAGAVGEQHHPPAGRSGIVGHVDDASGDDPHPGCREAGVEVVAQRGHVEHGVCALELVGRAGDDPAPGRGGERGQVGGELVEPGAVGGPPRRVRSRVDERGRQPEGPAFGGQRAARGPSADDEHLDHAVSIRPAPGGSG